MTAVLAASWPRGFAPMLKGLSVGSNFAGLTQQTLSTVTIVTGVNNVSAYNHHPFLTYFGSKFWAMFSTSPTNEDSDGQIVRYATSTDGTTWSAAASVTGAPGSGFRYTAQGWLIDGTDLYGLVARDEAGSYYGSSLEMRSLKWGGSSFGSETQFISNFICAFPPITLPSGARAIVGRNKDLSAVKLGIGQLGAWTFANITQPAAFTLSEGCISVLADSSLIITHRDNSNSGRILMTFADAAGGNITTPKLTNFPDATTKSCIFGLSNGKYVFASNPDALLQSRIPLILSVSDKGWSFDRAKLLRGETTSPVYAGTNKNAGYQYPSMFEKDGYLYVIYSRNKEDIQLSKIALTDIT